MSSSTLFRVLVFISVLLLGLAILFAPEIEEPLYPGPEARVSIPQR